MTDGPILIKRYPNRRYYARNTSRYVSLKEIEEMVQTGKTVEIRDNETGEDMTQAVLTQIIMERHPEKMPLFPTNVLHFILQSNDVMSGLLSDYFRHSLSYLDYLRRHNPAASSLAPMQWVKAWLENVPSTAASGHSSPPTNGMSSPPASDVSSPPASDVSSPPASGGETIPVSESAQLALRVKQLEERLEQLESGEP